MDRTIMHYAALIWLLPLTSVAAGKVITSIIQPPEGFRGDLQTFVENLTCEFRCGIKEREDGKEMLWLWRDEKDCGVGCSMTDGVGLLPPGNASDTTGTGSTGRPANGTSVLPATGTPDGPGTEPLETG